MAKWRVTIPQWEIEVDANDEGDALVQASLNFEILNEARAEEVEKQAVCENCGAADDLGVMDDDDVLLCKPCRDSTMAGE